MKKISYLVAAAIALSGAAQLAQANFIITSTRATTTVTEASGFSAVGGTVSQAVDVITFRVVNDGVGGTGTKVNGFNLTATTPGSTVATAFVFKGTDLTGNPGTGLSIDVAAEMGTSAQNNAAYNAATAGAGQSGGSWLRVGSTAFGLLYSTDVNGHAQPGGTFPENRQDTDGNGVDDFNPVPLYTNNHSFTVQGGFTSGAPTATSAIGLATLVVPVGTTVEIAGLIGGDSGASQSVDVTNSLVVIPEPASLGLLAVGGLALLARRKARKA